MNEFQLHKRWYTSPGDALSSILSKRDIEISEFADEIDEPIALFLDLLKGKRVLDVTIARKLEVRLGISSSFWLAREEKFRSAISNQMTPPAFDSETEFLSALPLSDMRKFGWIAATKAVDKTVLSVFEFFEVNSVSEWHQRYSAQLSVAAYRTSASFENDPLSVATWLRKAELEAEKISCARWNRHALQAALPALREQAQTRNPIQFLPELEKICARCGVALVIVRGPAGCRASGATKFISSSKAMIVLSMRHRTDDHFWFTFFHEIGHLLLHAEDALFIEDDSDVTLEQEIEANQFSQSVLFPTFQASDFQSIKKSARSIIRSAIRLRIAPGILVGQLQHMGLLPHDKLNSLKRRYTWSSSNLPMISP